MKHLSKSRLGNGKSQPQNRPYCPQKAPIQDNHDPKVCGPCQSDGEQNSRCPSSLFGPVEGVGPFSLCCTPLTLATQCPETHAVLSEKTIRLQSKELYIDQRQSPSKLEARADYFTYKIQTVEFWESASTPEPNKEKRRRKIGVKRANREVVLHSLFINICPLLSSSLHASSCKNVLQKNKIKEDTNKTVNQKCTQEHLRNVSEVFPLTVVTFPAQQIQVSQKKNIQLS